MKNLTAILFLFILTKQVNAQNTIESYLRLKGILRIGTGKNDTISFNDRGYTLLLPGATNDIRGVIISLEDRKVNLNDNPSHQIYPQATSKGFAVLYISTGIPVDLYFSEKTLSYIDLLLKNLFNQYKIPNKNIFFLGVNLAGHRALKYIEYCKKGKSSFKPDIKGIVLCDGVLDWARQWFEAKKGVRDNFAQSSVAEGKLIVYLLEKNLGGTPKNQLEKYLAFSPYSYFDESHRHIKYFIDLGVRAYTEPATHYWMDAKRKTTFDTNFPDMVGFINELKLAGNSKSELIVFNQDVNNKDLRNPDYTWSLVDKTELVNWMEEQSK
jgi:hypothetical protein